MTLLSSTFHKTNFDHLFLQDEEYNEKIAGCHQRSAERVLDGCLKNGGLYIKLGQGLVSMNHILPKEYLKTLEVLQDRALSRRLNEVALYDQL